MSVTTRLALASVLVLGVAAAPASAGASGEAPSKRAATATAANLLLQIQESLARMAVADAPVAEDVARLTRALVASKARPVADAALATLSTSVAAAVAQGSFDEETIERLAQNLFAAVNDRGLASREASLLVLDVSMVLGDAGAERQAVDAVILELSAICPAGTARIDAPVRPMRQPILSRR